MDNKIAVQVRVSRLSNIFTQVIIQIPLVLLRMEREAGRLRAVVAVVRP
jgi:hypothetical protein